LVYSTVCEFHFDELLKIPESPFGSKSCGDGGCLIGLDGSFGIIGYGAAAAGFYTFDFDSTGT
jgi:hypothetical protein